MLSIRGIFLTLDRQYMLEHTPERSLWDLGLRLFQQHLTSNQEVYDKLIAGLLELIGRERSGENIKQNIVKTLVRMLSAIQVYSDRFEPKFLSSTNAFYQNEGTQLVQQMSVADYLTHCSTRLQQENTRISEYLVETTRRALVVDVEHRLVRVHVPAMIQKGFEQLMNDNRKEDLARMYFLFSRVNKLEPLRDAFCQYVKSTGLGIVMDEKRDKRMIRDLIALHKRTVSIVADALNRDPDFTSKLSWAFDFFINERENKPAELLARFIDGMLRSGHKGSTHDELEALMVQLIELLRFVSAKDVFQAFYKKHLARRLLLSKSASRDAEQSMLMKMKEECGAGFTKKLEEMFKDIAKSQHLKQEFEAHIESSSSSSGAMLAADDSTTSSDKKTALQLEVQVLTTGCWPEYVHKDLKLAPVVTTRLEQFKMFYLGKHSGRKLVWHHALSTCILKAFFPKGRKELVCSAYQAAVLMLFNDRDPVTVNYALQATGLAPDDLRRTLESLCLGDVRILAKQPASKSVKRTDKFYFNRNFKHTLFRIKANAVQMKETKAERKKTTDRVFADRQYSIDATIVRIMKARKTLRHQQLMSEVLGQVKFPSTPADIKKRIASLLEREYLERDEEDSHVYNYMA
jgi:cullin 4